MTDEGRPRRDHSEDDLRRTLRAMASSDVDVQTAWRRHTGLAAAGVRDGRRRPARRGRAWSAVGWTIAVGAVTAGVIAFGVAPGSGRATRTTVTPVKRTTTTVSTTPTTASSTTTTAGPPSTTTTTNRSPSTTTTTLPPAGVHLDASVLREIPWSQVGPGWVLATWSQFVPEWGPGNVHDDPISLYLVSPVGTRYLLTTVPWSTNLSVTGWSGHTALLGYGGSWIVMDLQTGSELRSLPGSPSTGDEIYIAPGGNAVFDLAGRPRLESLQGTVDVTYPDSFSEVGAWNGGLVFDPTDDEVVLSAARGLAVVSLDGKLIAEIPYPDTHASGGCSLLHWYRTKAVVVSCAAPGVIALPTRLWEIPLSGAAPVQLTQAPKQPDLGDLDAWQVPSGVYLQDAGACGQIYLARLLPNGTTTPVWPRGAPRGGSVAVLGTVGDQLVLANRNSCGAGLNVYLWDAATGSEQILLGVGRNGGGVPSAVPYQEDVTTDMEP